VESKWRSIQTEVDTVNDRGEPIHLSEVKALQHSETRQIIVSPQAISQAEIESIAKKYGLKNARDVATFLILFATPSEGMVKGGDVLNKYHLQKSLFYLWKGLEDEGLYEVMPHDEFRGADHGPLPINLDNDLTELHKKKLISITSKKYLEFPKLLKHIRLTEEGVRVATKLWIDTPEDFKTKALWAKELIYPLTPDQVTEMVHKKYPEFIDVTKNDIE
jgi:hypothetical protein